MKPQIYFSAIELVSGFVTAPGTTETNITLCSGNSLTIRNSAEGSKVHLLSAWTKVQTAGILKILSPRMHDNVQNLRLPRLAGKSVPLLPEGFKQICYNQDTLRVLMTGSATAADIETVSLLLHYEDLPGAEARLATWDQIKDRIKNYISVPVSITTVATGDYGGEVAINSTYDLMKANTDYALIGYETTALCSSVRWRGIDTGNLGVGGPGGILDFYRTAEWFKKLSDEWGIPAIPIFNSANKSGILVDATTDENATATVVYSTFAELD
jgi:hypothetical protein